MVDAYLLQQQMAGTDIGGNDTFENPYANGEDKVLEFVLGRVGMFEDPSIQQKMLDRYADELTTQEYSIIQTEIAAAAEEWKKKNKNNSGSIKAETK